MSVKPTLRKDEDEAWVEEQLDRVYGAEEGYGDAQFEADVAKAGAVLDKLAEKARIAAENGTALKFPR